MLFTHTPHIGTTSVLAGIVWKYSLTVIALIFKFFCCSCICTFTVKMFSLINFCLDVGYIWWYTYLIKHTYKVTLLSCMMHYYQRQVAFHVLIGSWKDLFGWDVFGCRRNTTTLYTKENYVSELCRNNPFVYIPRLFHSFVYDLLDDYFKHLFLISAHVWLWIYEQSSSNVYRHEFKWRSQ